MNTAERHAGAPDCAPPGEVARRHLGVVLQGDLCVMAKPAGDSVDGIATQQVGFETRPQVVQKPRPAGQVRLAEQPFDGVMKIDISPAARRIRLVPPRPFNDVRRARRRPLPGVQQERLQVGEQRNLPRFLASVAGGFDARNVNASLLEI
ncbi:MAG: hypothetical protein NZM31_12695 [Gemmatales bacterium]|nr:hypothetical protein [Gemmatales bacterium]MDW8387853.1 hypothetical protein [Gemmatales bacterium]